MIDSSTHANQNEIYLLITEYGLSVFIINKTELRISTIRTFLIVAFPDLTDCIMSNMRYATCATQLTCAMRHIRDDINIKSDYRDWSRYRVTFFNV